MSTVLWLKVVVPNLASSSRILLGQHASRYKPTVFRTCRRARSSLVPGHPKDEAIEFPIVRLVNQETEKLDPPTSLTSLLSSLNRKEYFIELVSAVPEPIVKIISKKEDREKAKELKVRQRLNRVVQKEVQMTWGVASGDLAHKLKKVREELTKGNRVDLVYAPKKGQPLPSPTQMAKRATETMDLLTDIGKQWRPMDVRPNITIIYLERKPNATTSSTDV